MGEPVIEPPANNPPYYDDLMSLPEDIRVLVEPKFKEWDAKTTQKFQELHSEYEPWKDVIANFDPETVSQATQLADLLDKNPKALFDYMKEYFKFGDEQGQPGTVQPPAVVESTGEEDDLLSHPKFKEIETTVQQMATLLVSQQQQTTNAQMQQALDQTLAEFKQVLGDAYDDDAEDLLLNRLGIDGDPESTLKWYTDKVLKGQIPGTAGVAAPVVTSADGGSTVSALSGGKKPGELTNKETTDIVVQMLKQAAEAS